MTWKTRHPVNSPPITEKLAQMDIVALRDQVLAIVKDSDVPLSTGQLRRMLPKVKGYWELHGHACPTCQCPGDEPVFRKFFHDGIYEDNARIRTFLVKLEKEGKVEVFRSGVKGQPFSYRWIGGDDE